MSADTGPLLTVSRLAKRYGSVTVLRECDLDVRAGEVHALLGANGAGKSTLVRIIVGLVPMTCGHMEFGGQPFSPSCKRDAETAGVQIVQQELCLIPTLSVAENLLLTRLPSTAGVIRRHELVEQGQAALARLGLGDIPIDAPVGSLGVGHQQMVEIAAALDQDCKLLILDEPTAALSVAESEALFKQIRRLKDHGVGIIYISHRLDEVTQLADRVSILRDGKMMGTFAAGSLSTDEMVQHMSGDDVAGRDGAAHQSLSKPPVALRVEELTGGIVQGVSLTVHRGERFGIAGLVGSGRTELLRLIFGADPPTSGSVTVGNRGYPRRFQRPNEAVAAGIALVTEDRQANGLLLSQSIRVNSSLASLWNRFSRRGVVRSAVEAAVTADVIQSLDTRCTGIEQLVGTLSGGNQQKVAVAKWLVRGADVFLLDEPTRGIDVAARRKIYGLIETLAGDGKGIVIVSSDLEELIDTCDRIAVMSHGRLVETFDRSDWSQGRIMQAAFSGDRPRRSA